MEKGSCHHAQGRLLCMARWAGARGPCLEGAHIFLLNRRPDQFDRCSHAYATGRRRRLGNRSQTRSYSGAERRRTADASHARWIDRRSPEIAAADRRRRRLAVTPEANGRRGDFLPTAFAPGTYVRNYVSNSLTRRAGDSLPAGNTSSS